MGVGLNIIKVLLHFSLYSSFPLFSLLQSLSSFFSYSSYSISISFSPFFLLFSLSFFSPFQYFCLTLFYHYLSLYLSFVEQLFCNQCNKCMYIQCTSIFINHFSPILKYTYSTIYCKLLLESTKLDLFQYITIGCNIYSFSIPLRESEIEKRRKI